MQIIHNEGMQASTPTKQYVELTTERTVERFCVVFFSVTQTGEISPSQRHLWLRCRSLDILC